jgi:hypothetical protein
VLSSVTSVIFRSQCTAVRFVSGFSLCASCCKVWGVLVGVFVQQKAFFGACVATV